MKLRLDRGAIIFRISQEELHLLPLEKSLHESIHYSGKSKITISVVVDSALKDMEFTFQGFEFCLSISANLLEALLLKGRSKDGIYSELKLNDGREFQYGIEVDFKSRPI